MPRRERARASDDALQLEGILDALGEAVLVHDPRGRVRWRNQLATELSLELPRGLLAQARRDGWASAEITAACTDGSERRLYVRVTAMREAGVLQGTVATAGDVT